jgi:hypothetical protein
MYIMYLISFPCIGPLVQYKGVVYTSISIVVVSLPRSCASASSQSRHLPQVYSRRASVEVRGPIHTPPHPFPRHFSTRICVCYRFLARLSKDSKHHHSRGHRQDVQPRPSPATTTTAMTTTRPSTHRQDVQPRPSPTTTTTAMTTTRPSTHRQDVQPRHDHDHTDHTRPRPRPPRPRLRPPRPRPRPPRPRV